jgi:hypothetical protein
VEYVHEIILKPDLSRFCVYFFIEESTPLFSLLGTPRQESPLHSIVILVSQRASSLDITPGLAQIGTGIFKTEKTCSYQLFFTWVLKETGTSKH